MNPHLLAQSGPSAGQRFELTAGLVTIGREPGNAVVIADQTVSRNHARVSVINGAATIEDAGSTGGTFVNDVRIAGPMQLKVGDVIRLGGSTFAFVPAASVSPMAVTATMPTRAGRRKEVGSAEAAKPPVPTAGPALPPSRDGCMPDLSQFGRDLDGCMPLLLRLLLIALIIIIVSALLGGVVFLIGVLAGGAGALSGKSPAAPTTSGSGSPSGGGNPPPEQQSPQQQPPPTQSANGAIRILKVKTAWLAREGYLAPVPVALIDWQNVGKESVVEVFADVTSFDKLGAVIGLQKAVRIYTGAEVEPNGTHEDDEVGGGVILSLDQGKTHSLDHATVTPTEVRVVARGS
ncbi:MAG: FHA domain-containing protein [Fimbriimonadaceae bacterium]